LGPTQDWRGYSMLICKEPATELDELEPWFRAQFLADMARLAAAVREAVEVNKLSCESLGNQVHHLHWHIFPRTLDEPTPLLPVWQCMPEDETPYLFDPAHDTETILAIRRALADDLV